MFPEHQLCAVQAKHPLYHSCSPKRSAPEGTSEEEQLADGRMGFSSESVISQTCLAAPSAWGSGTGPRSVVVFPEAQSFMASTSFRATHTPLLSRLLKMPSTDSLAFQASWTLARRGQDTCLKAHS